MHYIDGRVLWTEGDQWALVLYVCVFGICLGGMIFSSAWWVVGLVFTGLAVAVGITTWYERSKYVY